MKKKNFFNFVIIMMFAFFLQMLIFSAFGITIESQNQKMELDKNKGYFDGNVKVQVGDVLVTSPRAELDLEPKTKKPSLATFFDKPYARQTKGNKKHEVKSDIIEVSLIKKVITARGSAQTSVLEDQKPLVIITSDTQEYDTNTNLMSALGNVVINYEDVSATSDKAYALLDKSGDVKNIKLVSKAKLKQGNSIVKGDTINYSSLRQDIIVSGNTLSDVTFENGDRVVINARNQQYDRLSNTIIASGKVHALYSDYIADGPRAVIYIDKTTNKPERIVFSGRSTITENKKNSVTADKITITMDPKTFEAQGNVKTNIEDTNHKKDEKMEFSL